LIKNTGSTPEHSKTFQPFRHGLISMVVGVTEPGIMANYKLLVNASQSLQWLFFPKK
jgi:hypothetical protein